MGYPPETRVQYFLFNLPNRELPTKGKGVWKMGKILYSLIGQLFKNAIDSPRYR